MSIPYHVRSPIAARYGPMLSHNRARFIILRQLTTQPKTAKAYFITQYTTQLYHSIIFIAISLTAIITFKFIPAMPLIISSIIYLFLLGILSVASTWLITAWTGGSCVSVLVVYRFLTGNYLFLSILALLESASVAFCTITISNRLSINLFAGSLLVYLIGGAVIACLYTILIPGLLVMIFVVFAYEQVNLLIQTGIYMVLSDAYSVSSSNNHSAAA